MAANEEQQKKIGDQRSVLIRVNNIRGEGVEVDPNRSFHEIRLEWENFYENAYGIIGIDLSNIKIPKPPEPRKSGETYRLLIMIKGLNAYRAKILRIGKCAQCNINTAANIDLEKADIRPDESYSVSAIWVVNGIDPDYIGPNKGLAETLPMHMVHFLKVYYESGKFLNEIRATTTSSYTTIGKNNMYFVASLNGGMFISLTGKSLNAGQREIVAYNE